MVYKEAAELASQELTIRTLDIGGDKALPYLGLPTEENPYIWKRTKFTF